MALLKQEESDVRLVANVPRGIKMTGLSEIVGK